MSFDQLKKNFKAPFFLDKSEPEKLKDFLLTKQFLSLNDKIKELSKAGEGNMNYCLRMKTENKSYIIKQARPWVEKYPQIKAPDERACVEANFFKLVSDKPKLAQRMPKLLCFDKEARLLVLEDLGQKGDYTSLYSEGTLKTAELKELVLFLTELHSSKTPVVQNNEMKVLNHEHMFRFPLLKEDGMPLNEITEGLQELADKLRADSTYVRRVTELGNEYLDQGCHLLHGDFFPGSWYKSEAGIKIIDPEFCFSGPVEFELGVFMAHLLFIQQPENDIEKALSQYSKLINFKRSQVQAFAGVELMRRLIGVAQLPIQQSLKEKAEFLEISRKFVLEGI